MADLAALSVCCPAASHSSGLADRVWKQDNQIIWLDYFFLDGAGRHQGGLHMWGASGERKCWVVSCLVVYLR